MGGSSSREPTKWEVYTDQFSIETETPSEANSTTPPYRSCNRLCNCLDTRFN